jgi:hypothetical protein
MSKASLGKAEIIGVSKNAGATATQLIPNGAKSFAIGSTIPLIAPFVAEYPNIMPPPSSAATLLVNTIDPLYPLSFGLFLEMIFEAYLAV